METKTKGLLVNWDPGELGDVLSLLETSLGFEFERGDLCQVGTFGQLCDLVVARINADEVGDCSSQQAFYKLRNAIVQVQNIKKEAVTPDVHLDIIFERKGRRLKIKHLSGILGVNARILEPKPWISIFFAVVFLSGLILLYPFFKIGLIAIAISLIASRLGNSYGIEFRDSTVGALSLRLVTEHYRAVRRNSNTVNKREVIFVIREIFKDRFGLEDEALCMNAKLY